MKDEAEFPQAVREYLQSVAACLGNVPPDVRQDILNDLEAHIRERLAERAGGRPATEEDATDVLSEMDPPESYADAQTAPVHVSGGWRRLTGGQWALCVSLAGLLLTCVLIAVSRGYCNPVYYLFFLACQIAAFVLGIRHWKDGFGKAAVVTSALVAIGSLLFVA